MKRKPCLYEYWTWLTLSIFAALILVGISAHELWRDETQAWAVARDSTSLWQLLTLNLRYEGHPPAWYLCLFALTRFTHNPLAMQLLHAVMAIAVAAALLCYAPFPRWQRVLLIFGYFPLYEWGVLSRNYSLGILAFFVFLALYPQRKVYLLPLAFLLALMANANPYSMQIALALSATLVFEFLWDRARADKENSLLPSDWVISVVVILVGFAISFWFLIPPSDRWSGNEIHTSMYNLGGAFAAIWNGWVPLPNFSTYHFWNSNILELIPTHSILTRGLLGILFVILGTLLLLRKPVPLAFFLLGIVGIWAFSFLIWPGYLRHHGHFFFVFVGALWLATYHLDEEVKPRWLPQRLRVLPNLTPAMLGVLAGLHVIAAGYAMAMDFNFPFSNSRTAAQYLRLEGLDRKPIVGSKDYLVSPLSTYLDVPLYYPGIGEWGSYWIARKRPYLRGRQDPMSALDEARQLANSRREPVILVLSSPLILDKKENSFVSKLAYFDDSMLDYNSGFSRLEPEFFYIYEVHPRHI